MRGVRGCKLLLVELLFTLEAELAIGTSLTPEGIGNLSLSSRAPLSFARFYNIPTEHCTSSYGKEPIQSVLDVVLHLSKQRGEPSPNASADAEVLSDVLANATQSPYRTDETNPHNQSPFSHCPSLARRCRTGTELGGTIPSSVTIMVM